MKTSEFLEIVATAKDGKHKVKELAYSGGKMRLFGWSRPVVVDLSGMNIPGDVPLLTNHTNFTGGRIGLVTATLTESGLEIPGEIVAGDDAAENIITQGKGGVDWQLSIGAEVEAAELVQEGKRIGKRVSNSIFTVYVVFMPGHPYPCGEACSVATATWASWVMSARCSPAPSADLSRP